MSNNNINNGSAAAAAAVAQSSLSFTFADDEQSIVDDGHPAATAKAVVKVATGSADDCINDATPILSEGASSSIAASESRLDSCTPTQVNISKRGADDVYPYPLAMAATTNSRKMILGRGASPVVAMMEDEKHPSHDTNNNNDSNNKMQNRVSPIDKIYTQEDNSPEMSELTFVNSPGRIQKRSSALAPDSSKSSKLNDKQQAAMDNFLKAQLSGNPISKEMRWKELVRAMKENDSNSSVRSGTTTPSFRRSNSGGGANNTGSKRKGYSSSNRSCSSNKSLSSSGKDDILGLLKIGGNASDVISIESGLTSEGVHTQKGDTINDWDSTGQWKSTPNPSPTKGGNDFNVLGEIGIEADEHKGSLRYRTMTPPNVPLLKDDNLPLVSPLSVDGSFDEEEEVKGTTELGLLNPDDDAAKEDGEQQRKGARSTDKEKSPCFFNLGASFVDNTKHLWNEPSLSMEVAATFSDDNGESISLNEKQQNTSTSSPTLLPMPRRSLSPIVRAVKSPKILTKEVPLSIGTSCDDTAGISQSSISLVAQSIEGDVVLFDDVEESQQQSPQLSKEEDNDIMFEASFPPEAALSEQPPTVQQLSEAIQLTRTEELPQPKQKGSSKRRGKASLEEQILNVLQQQPESHVVVEEEQFDNEEEEIYARGSPILSSAGTTKSKKKKSGTVGSATSSLVSAQDILKELRSSTPCTFQSGNSLTNSSLNGTNTPLGSISERLAALEESLEASPKLGEAQEEKTARVTSQSPPEEIAKKSNSRSTVLPPSRRDVPRPNRINRRASSEPTRLTPQNLPTPDSLTRNAADTSFDSCSPTISGEIQDIATKEAHIAELLESKIDASSQEQQYYQVMGMEKDNEPAPPHKGFFPRTLPAQSTNPFDTYPSTNQFDSPPRPKFAETSEEPFEAQSSPIPVERSGETAESQHNVFDISIEPYDDDADKLTVTTSSISVRDVAPPSSLPPRRERLPPHHPSPSSSLVLPPSKQDSVFRSNVSPPSPQTTSSSRSSPSVDEIRETISQLKENGVGGVGKPTSTLIRSEKTGRYIIRDVDDDKFATMHHPNMNDDEEQQVEKVVYLNQQQEEEEEEEEMVLTVKQRIAKLSTSSSNIKRSATVEVSKSRSDESNLERSSQQPVKEEELRYNPLQHLNEATIMDDDAVDAAVLAATEDISLASSTASEEEDEEDIFVIRKPQQGQAQWGEHWSAFETSDKVAQDDDFDIQPSDSWGDWDDNDDDQGWGFPATKHPEKWGDSSWDTCLLEIK